jgi:hypothetical protein
VRFVDFLKVTVLLSAGAATLLAVLTLLSASQDFEPNATYFSIGWWAIAAVIGSRLGRRAEATPPIARLLATARTATTLPELHPGRTLANRLWPLLLMTLGAGVTAVFIPQVAGVATGFAIIWALAWRRQEGAVAAIEERDGVRFYVERGPAFKPTQLVRTPWMRRIEPPLERISATR